MKKRRKLIHFFRGFLYLASTSNPSASDNTRTKIFFFEFNIWLWIIAENWHSFSGIFVHGMHSSNPLASNNTRIKVFLIFILDYEK